MFTATVKNKDFFNGEVRVEVEFLQDDANSQPFIETFRPRSKNELDQMVRSRISQLEAMESFVENLTPGVYAFETAPVIPPPTEEEIARDTWLTQWHLYTKATKAMQALADAGFTPTDDEVTRFQALKQWVANNRRPEYAEFI